MKIAVNIKCPDALLHAIEKAAEDEIGGSSNDEELDIVFDELVNKCKKIAEKWFRYNECVRLIIDTDLETCVVEQVLPNYKGSNCDQC